MKSRQDLGNTWTKRVTDSSPEREPSDLNPQLANALTRALRRLLWRAALFFLIIPRFAMLSMTGTAESYAAWAFSTLPVSTAAITCLIFVRTKERRLALCVRHLSFWRARFRAWGEFATEGLRWAQKRSRIIWDTLSIVNRDACLERLI